MIIRKTHLALCRLLAAIAMPGPRRIVAGFAPLAFLMAACGTMGNSDDTAEFWSPFSSQSAWEVGDGRVRVELSGFERGHEPGRVAAFDLSIENRRDEPADLAVCAELIDEVQVVQRFNRFEVALEPNGNHTSTFEAAFDEGLEPRAYGLAVVIGDLGAVIHTVRVGIPDDEAGPWLDADELVCD
jgi:hypothetical protein